MADRWGRIVGLGILALGFLVVALAPGRAAESRRLALVVGIGAYQHLPRLGNTIGDARLIADKLRGTGFDVDLETDLSKAQLVQAVRDFGRRIEAAGPDTIAALYYAGHGLQDDKQNNFLVGADADLRSQVDLPLEALSLEAALQTLEAGRPALTFVILDACRDNPLPASDRRGGKRGLAVEAERRGLLIAFSTEPGKTALDGPENGHSPFAAALAEELDVPGLEATQLFKLVTKKVLDATREEQFPWVSQRLVEDFYFRPDTSAPAPKPPAQAVIPPDPAAPEPRSAKPDGGAADTDAAEIAYGQAVIENSTERYEDWLRRFPSHERKASVLALLQRLREEELWRRADGAASPQDAMRALEIELLAFPNGVYTEKARIRLAALQEAEKSAIPDSRPPIAEPARPTAAVRRLANSDAPGNDRGGYITGVSTVEECERTCIGDAGCAGYTYNIRRQVCILKNAIGPIARAPEPAITGVIDARARRSAPDQVAGLQRFRYYQDMDAPKNDLIGFVGGVSFAECEQVCLSNPACAGYTYNRKRSVCIPKSRIGRLSPAAEPAVTGVLQGRF